jgi:hypothetical protein
MRRSGAQLSRFADQLGGAAMASVSNHGGAGRSVALRAVVATHWYQHITFPLQWTGNQVFFLLPTIALIALLYGGRKRAQTPMPVSGQAAFDRRYVTALALGPFAVTTLVSAALGRLPVSMWGYPLWSFLPLAALMWLGPVAEPRQLRRFAAGVLVVLLGFPAAYAAIELLEPFVHDRAKATQFPGAAAAAAITTAWHERFNAPLAYVCGSEFDANNLAVYSPDRPHLMFHWDPNLSPWIEMSYACRRGIAIVFDRTLADTAMIDRWHATLGPFEIWPPLTTPRQTLHPVRPAEVFYGFVAPQ